MRVKPVKPPTHKMHIVSIQSQHSSPIANGHNNSRSPRAIIRASFTAKTEFVEEVVALGLTARAVIWCTIVLVMLFNGALLSVSASLYMGNSKRDSLLWLFRTYFLFSEGNAFLQNHSETVAAGYAILAATFLLLVVHMVWLTIRKRAFQLSSRIGTSKLASIGTHTAPGRITKAYRRLHHLIGVRGAYFELRLLAEEYLEMLMMTLAAHSASRTISNKPLNLIFGALIFTNGISARVICSIFKDSLIKQRIACLLTDLVIDFVWGTLLPLWMYVPLINIYMDRGNITNYIATFANSTREIERVLILSWRYYLLSVVPFISTLSNLVEVQNIMREIAPKAGEPTTDGQGATFIHLVHPVGRRHHGRLVRLAHWLMPVYGLGILITVLAANGVFYSPPKSDLYTCLHRVHPWFSTKEACLGRQINCTTAAINGTTSELATALDAFDESSLADLFFVSCPQLEMPPKIHVFNRLMTIVVLDSTLVEWSDEASLTAKYYEELRTIQLTSVTLLQDPQGLLGDVSISPSAEWIHLENINAANMLLSVGDKWKGLLFFDCMGCGLTEFPDMLYRLPRLTMLSLWVNDIPSIPNEWLEGSNLQLQALWLGFNPRLTVLPDSLWRQASHIGIFSFDWTNLSHVPDWVAGIAGREFLVNAVDTPVCTGAAPLSNQVKHLVICKSFFE